MTGRLVALGVILSAGLAFASEAPTRPCLPACPAPLSCQAGNKCIDLAAEAESVKEWDAVRPPTGEEARAMREGVHVGLALEGGSGFTTYGGYPTANWSLAFLVNYATGLLDLRMALNLNWNITYNGGWGPQLRFGAGLRFSDRFRMSLMALFGGYFDAVFINPSPVLGLDFQPVVFTLGGKRNIEFGVYATMLGITSWRFDTESNAKSIDTCKAAAKSNSVYCKITKASASFNFGLRLSFLFF